LVKKRENYETQKSKKSGWRRIYPPTNQVPQPTLQQYERYIKFATSIFQEMTANNKLDKRG
jgi:hypothetical protein